MVPGLKLVILIPVEESYKDAVKEDNLKGTLVEFKLTSVHTPPEVIKKLVDVAVLSYHTFPVAFLA